MCFCIPDSLVWGLCAPHRQKRLVRNLCPVSPRIPHGSATAPPADASAAAPASAALAVNLSDSSPHRDAAAFDASSLPGSSGGIAQAGPPELAGGAQGVSSEAPVVVQPDGPDGLPDPSLPAVVPRNVLAETQAAHHAAQQAALVEGEAGTAASDLSPAQLHALTPEAPSTDLSVPSSAPLDGPPLDSTDGRDTAPDGQKVSAGGGESRGDDAAAVADAAIAALDVLTEQAGGVTEPPVQLPQRLTEEMRRLLDWHWAQLEYGCSAPLNKVS